MGDVTGIESFIDGSEKLVRIFGYWPSFHDAEVIDLHLWREVVEATPCTRDGEPA